MIEQAVDDVDRAIHEVHDAVGKSTVLVDQVEHELLGERHLLRWLEYERVPARDRKRQEPERHHRREVERADRRAHTDRLADRLAVDRGGDVFENAPLHRLRHRAGGLDHLDRPADLGPGVGKRLSHLARDRPGDLVLMGLEHLAEAKQPPATLDHRALAPIGVGGAGGGDGGVNIGATRERHAREHLTVGGIADVKILLGDRRYPRSVDVVTEQPGFRCRRRHVHRPLVSGCLKVLKPGSAARRHRTLCLVWPPIPDTLYSQSRICCSLEPLRDAEVSVAAGVQRLGNTGGLGARVRDAVCAATCCAAASFC